jgi:hypothetical protein
VCGTVRAGRVGCVNGSVRRVGVRVVSETRDGNRGRVVDLA